MIHKSVNKRSRVRDTVRAPRGGRVTAKNVTVCRLHDYQSWSLSTFSQLYKLSTFDSIVEDFEGKTFSFYDRAATKNFVRLCRVQKQPQPKKWYTFVHLNTIQLFCNFRKNHCWRMFNGTGGGRNFVEILPGPGSDGENPKRRSHPLSLYTTVFPIFCSSNFPATTHARSTIEDQSWPELIKKDVSIIQILNYWTEWAHRKVTTVRMHLLRLCRECFCTSRALSYEDKDLKIIFGDNSRNC